MRRVLFVAVVLFAASAAARAQGQQPVNLKVLPKDMPRQEVVQIMRSFTRALGVRCQHCHVGEGNDLSKFDFASDAKPAKEIARTMLRMVMDINTRHLADVVVPAAPVAAPDPAAPPVAATPPPAAAPAGQPPTPRVTCFTCHRGALKPLTAPPPAEGRGGRPGL